MSEIVYYKLNRIKIVLKIVFNITRHLLLQWCDFLKKHSFGNELLNHSLCLFQILFFFKAGIYYPKQVLSN